MNRFGYYYFKGYKIDVFGYDSISDRYEYSVETDYSCKIRRAKAYFKYPDKRNECLYEYGTYIYIIDPYGYKKRLFLR